MKMKGFLYLLWVGCLVACHQKETEFETIIGEKTKIEVLDSIKVTHRANHFFNKIEKLKRFSGTVLIAERGKIVYKKAFGYANLRNKNKNHITTKFQLASVSKPLTAIGVMKLIHEGKVELQDTVGKFIKGWPYQGITIRHLLTHYSGLSNYMYFSDVLWDYKKQPLFTNDSLLNLIKKEQPMPYLKPEKKYNYCNTNYAILASIIEKVSKKSFQKYMKEEVFAPAGMKNTFVYEHLKTDLKDSTLARGYEGFRREKRYVYLDGIKGDKGIYSTVDDMFLLDRYLYTNIFLDDSLKRISFTAQHDELHAHDNYGLGWRIDDVTLKKEKCKLVYHSGWWKGFKTSYFRFVGKDAVVIILGNRLAGHISKKSIIYLLTGKY